MASCSQRVLLNHLAAMGVWEERWEGGGMWGEGRGEWMCGRGEGVRCVDVLEGRGQAKWVCGRGEGTGWVGVVLVTSCVVCRL